MIAKILILASRLPSGVFDPKSPRKLVHEASELVDALENDDYTGALTEVADVVYYACKSIYWACSITGISVAQGFLVCVAKYTLRARPTNPKDDAAEREAVLAVFND